MTEQCIITENTCKEYFSIVTKKWLVHLVPPRDQELEHLNKRTCRKRKVDENGKSRDMISSVTEKMGDGN